MKTSRFHFGFAMALALAAGIASASPPTDIVNIKVVSHESGIGNDIDVNKNVVPGVNSTRIGGLGQDVNSTIAGAAPLHQAAGTNYVLTGNNQVLGMKIGLTAPQSWLQSTSQLGYTGANSMPPPTLVKMFLRYTGTSFKTIDAMNGFGTIKPCKTLGAANGGGSGCIYRLVT